MRKIFLDMDGVLAKCTLGLTSAINHDLENEVNYTSKRKTCAETPTATTRHHKIHKAKRPAFRRPRHRVASASWRQRIPKTRSNPKTGYKELHAILSRTIRLINSVMINP